MSSETPSGHLARIRLAHPLWEISPSTAGAGFYAHRDGQPPVWVPDLPTLEVRLGKLDHDTAGRRAGTAGPKGDSFASGPDALDWCELEGQRLSLTRWQL